MRFYQQPFPPHRFYCGVDLHARTMYLCILDQAGSVVLHKEVPAAPDAFLQAIAPFRDGLVVACECLFCWYWLSASARHGESAVTPRPVGPARPDHALLNSPNDHVDSPG